MFEKTQHYTDRCRQRNINEGIAEYVVIHGVVIELKGGKRMYKVSRKMIEELYSQHRWRTGAIADQIENNIKKISEISRREWLKNIERAMNLCVITSEDDVLITAYRDRAA